jgi:hypothetical protein
MLVCFMTLVFADERESWVKNMLTTLLVIGAILACGVLLVGGVLLLAYALAGSLR